MLRLGAKMNEKYTIMTPFDITMKMLGPSCYRRLRGRHSGTKWTCIFKIICSCHFLFRSARASLSRVTLFKESCLKPIPAKLRDLDRPENVLKQLELMDRATPSISDADLVDALIHVY